MEGQSSLGIDSIRTRFVNLASQQRHLRHLSAIFARNIDPNFASSGKSANKSGLLSLFFTLHTKDEKIELYRSETIDNSLNPSWNEFDASYFGDGGHSSATEFTVCIWAKRTNKVEIIIKQKLHFDALMYFGDQLKPRGKGYNVNTLIFKMFGKFYTCTCRAQNGSSTESNEDNLMKMLLKVDQESVRLAYKKSSLLRVHCMLKAVHETKQQVRKARYVIEHSLHEQEQERHRLKSIERERLNHKISMMKEELNNLKDIFQAELDHYAERKTKLQDSDQALRLRQDDLEQYIANMKICHSSHIVNRETHLKVSAQLSYRRKQLAAELSYIFPVVEIPQRGSAKQQYAITGVKLPASDEITGADDEMVSVALGNTSHLVSMMAKFIELPLRYPLRPMGSRSAVVDLVKDRLTDKEREFPLYLKGKEKYQFHYGVFLLNKNIAQLRYHCGLGTSDLRLSLSNLKHLFETKFGVKVILRPDTETLQQRISQTPPGRSYSENEESNNSSSPQIKDAYAKLLESPPRRPMSYHFDKDIGPGTIHKSSSQGELKNRKGGKLPTVPNRTQMHHLINRKTKKGLNQSRIISDQESPSSDDRLLEVPFEELIKGKINKNSRKAVTNNDETNGNTAAEPKRLVSSDSCDNVEKKEYTNGDYTDNIKIYPDSTNVRMVCSECIRDGRNCLECEHIGKRTVSMNDVDLEQNDVLLPRQYKRQFSDILLIPGPFENQDKIASPDETNASNIL